MHLRPLLLLPILITCLPVAAVLLATPAAAAAATTCAPKTCGNLTIAYPFWIVADSTNSSSSSSPCGPAAFQVNCDLAGGRASLAQSFRGGYKILRIGYDATRTLLVANDNVQTDERGCPVPRIDVSASLSLAPFTASPANAQLLFLFNCTRPGFVDVTCPGTNAVVRLDPAYNATAGREVAGGCDHAVVPVMVGFPGAGPRDYPRLLREGYLLQWRASPGNCTACSDSGGRCGYDPDADAFACVCDDGSSTPARCGTLLVLIASQFLSQVPDLERRRSSRDTANVEQILQKHGALAPKRYRYSELKAITNSFAHKLGEGGYGAVFRGVLMNDGNKDDRRREVAVKVLHNNNNNSSRPNGAEEFLNEHHGLLGGDGGGEEEEVAMKMALIGLWCIQTVPASRPSMSRVLEMLERSVHELPMPPRPYHASPSNSPSPSSHPSSYPSTTFASDSTQRSRLRTTESTM
ncbi:hypothetical protein PR202_gb26512 [Eleusine coracana subsp. coracana]|uniref:Protein kinase domain-containing protein n=1 Tax=Eleusine coracana subsp. coracana TaxID=191504 RepID=A0AAV5FSD0_ELECO|nr:hypothetical protein PR202_gb26512 [Eleusine coracana subsp. coracana]